MAVAEGIRMVSTVPVELDLDEAAGLAEYLEPGVEEEPFGGLGEVPGGIVLR
jgi:hypothetical protein